MMVSIDTYMVKATLLTANYHLLSRTTARSWSLSCCTHTYVVIYSENGLLFSCKNILLDISQDDLATAAFKGIAQHFGKLT